MDHRNHADTSTSEPKKRGHCGEDSGREKILVHCDLVLGSGSLKWERPNYRGINGGLVNILS